MLKMKKHNKKRLEIFLLSLLFLPLFIHPVYAETTNFSKDQMALKFSFPEKTELTEIIGNSNVIKYNDNNFSSIYISSADIYYTVTNNGDKALIKKYPKNDVWLQCGLFDTTWNNKDYVFDYLKKAVNGSSVKYFCSIDEIKIDGMPFYKFTYMQEENNIQMSGGIIYLTLYQSTLYNVQFFHSYNFASIEPYISAFESTLQIDGIKEYKFKQLKDKQINLGFIAAPTALVLVVGGMLIYIFRKRSRKGK